MTSSVDHATPHVKRWRVCREPLGRRIDAGGHGAPVPINNENQTLAGAVPLHLPSCVSRTMHAHATLPECPARSVGVTRRRERGVRLVVALAAVAMVAEITVGHVFGSMALLADGWHMATHVAALGLAAMSYTLARRYAGHAAFTFGTGRITTLGAFTSAVVLGMVALVMGMESIGRLASPELIDIATSLPVALLGLAVNLLSAWILLRAGAHDHGHAYGHGHAAHDHAHDHGPDHNHRAALAHVMADILTSVLAIVALAAASLLGWVWLDPLVGIVGAMVICHWSLQLCRGSAAELLGIDPGRDTHERVRSALTALDDVEVQDLRVWPIGPGQACCAATIRTTTPRPPEAYRRQILAACPLAHLTIEVRSTAPSATELATDPLPDASSAAC